MLLSLFEIKEKSIENLFKEINNIVKSASKYEIENIKHLNDKAFSFIIKNFHKGDLEIICNECKGKIIILSEIFKQDMRKSFIEFFNEFHINLIYHEFTKYNMDNLYGVYKNILEMRIETPEPFVEEISIQGFGIENFEFEELLKEDYNIVYLWFYHGIMETSYKIFNDGRIVTIPDRDLYTINNTVCEILENAEK